MKWNWIQACRAWGKPAALRWPLADGLVFDTRLDGLEISTRTANCLRNAGYRTIRDVLHELDGRAIMCIPNFGPVCMRDLITALYGRIPDLALLRDAPRPGVTLEAVACLAAFVDACPICQGRGVQTLGPDLPTPDCEACRAERLELARITLFLSNREADHGDPATQTRPAAPA